MEAQLLTMVPILACLMGCSSTAKFPSTPPNIVVILADDLGYGDIGPFGHPTIATPHLNRMAHEGMKLTQFYTAASVCTPSRAGLLTGRLPIRYGLASDEWRVLFPFSTHGIPSEEITLAEALREGGYATAIFGKWHLGHLEPYLPLQHGFDTYLGIPYSNDMYRDPAAWTVHSGFPRGTPLVQDNAVIDDDVDQTTLTRRYTEHAVDFITKNQDRPFFIYLPHTFPHTPLFASEQFAGKSLAGLYGDVVEEIDWSIGRILQTLRELKLAESTLVIFTSDNGPWLTQNDHGGSAGLLRDGKGSTWEGGMRVPTLAWWPGTIEAGRVSATVSSTLDIFPTACKIAGIDLPSDREYDGEDLAPILTGSSNEREIDIFYYHGTQLYAVRQGPWKIHFTTHTEYVDESPVVHDPPLLFNLEIDPSEKRNVADSNPEIVTRLTLIAQDHKGSFLPKEDPRFKVDSSFFDWQ